MEEGRGAGYDYLTQLTTQQLRDEHLRVCTAYKEVVQENASAEFNAELKARLRRDLHEIMTELDKRHRIFMDEVAKFLKT